MDVAIIIGSDSDWGVMKDAAEILQKFGVCVEVTVASAHRTPDKVREFVKTCDEHGAKIFIAAAGMAAHLAGVVASYTTKPVIGVPQFKCRRVFPLQQCLLTVQKMPLILPQKFLRFPMTTLNKNLTNTAQIWLRKSRKRQTVSNTRFLRLR